MKNKKDQHEKYWIITIVVISLIPIMYLILTFAK